MKMERYINVLAKFLTHPAIGSLVAKNQPFLNLSPDILKQVIGAKLTDDCVIIDIVVDKSVPHFSTIHDGQWISSPTFSVVLSVPDDFNIKSIMKVKNLYEVNFSLVLQLLSVYSDTRKVKIKQRLLTRLSSLELKQRITKRRVKLR